MKKDWVIKKLGEVCLVERGSSPRPIEKYQTDSPDGVNWIKIGDTKGVDKYIFTTREKITKEGAEKSRYVKEGDFILSNSMSFGRPYIMKTDGYIHDGWFVFRLPDYIDKDYFYYLLTSPNVQEQIQSLGAGAIVKNISGDLVKKVDITYPKSLSEQQRIVSILDEAFAAIAKAKANTEQNLKNAKELFESYLQGVFEKKGEGWDEKKLGEVIKLEYGKPLDESKRNPNGKYPMYGANGIKGRTDEFYHNKKSIIVGRKGSAGEINLTDEKFWPLDVTYFVVFDEKKYDLMFLYFLLSKLELPKLAKGVKPGINRNEVYEIHFSFPPLKEQQTIVHQLDTLRAETQKLEAVYQKKIDDLEELKKSILQKAFAGELKTEKAIAV